MQPVGEVQEAVVHRDDQVGDQPRHAAGQRPALELDVVDLDHRLGLEAAIRAVEAGDLARERHAGEALLGLGVVQEAHLERHQPLLAEVQGLHEPPLGEIPEVQPLPVTAGADVVDVEAGLVGVRLTELRRDQHVLARLVPEVVAQLRRRAAVLPAALHLERARVEHGEATGAIAVGVAEHADDDVVARHAVDRVRARVARLLDELLALDHLLDPRPPRVVGHVDDVDARGAKAGHDQVRAIRPVAGRAAAVPAEVMQLVADVRHRRLVHDPAVLGIDDGEEVRLARRRCPRAGRRDRGTPRAWRDAPLEVTRRTSGVAPGSTSCLAPSVVKSRGEATRRAV